MGMAITKEEAIKWIVDQQINDRNRDVYEKRLMAPVPPEGFDQVPRCIYFYYVRIDRNGRITVDHYFYHEGEGDDPAGSPEIPYDTVPKIIARLAINGRPRTRDRDKNPPKSGQSFRDVIWEYVSYIAIFFDEANWTFHRREGNKPSIAFNEMEGSAPNNSFFDLKDVEVDMSDAQDGSDKRSAVYFVNHLRPSDDPAVPPEERNRQRFKFDMYLSAKYVTLEDAVTIIFDPGGTNQGPPQ